jgi:hypothetical protein
VVAITPDGTVTTQGDAYEKPDPFTVPSTTLTTSVVAHVPAGGQVLAFLGSPFGLFWLLSGGVLLFGMPLLDRYRASQQRGNDLEEQLAAMTAALEKLPAQIEQAVATAVASIEPPAPAPRFVAASEWKPPTPDLMGLFAQAKPAAKSRWDAPPRGLTAQRGGLLCGMA